jgi:hypothetical protein
LNESEAPLVFGGLDGEGSRVKEGWSWGVIPALFFWEAHPIAGEVAKVLRPNEIAVIPMNAQEGIHPEVSDLAVLVTDIFLGVECQPTHGQRLIRIVDLRRKCRKVVEVEFLGPYLGAVNIPLDEFDPTFLQGWPEPVANSLVGDLVEFRPKVRLPVMRARKLRKCAFGPVAKVQLGIAEGILKAGRRPVG